LLIKYIKSFLWRVVKCLSYIEEARCLKVNACFIRGENRNGHGVLLGKSEGMRLL